LILTDDQGFGDAGFNGNPILKTPNLDSLAAGGVVFTDFQASPTCSPSRAALLTGRHEFRSGVTHTIEGRNILRAGLPTMADAFRQAGYRTAIFGKWHLGEPRPFHPLDRGFQHALLVGGGATGQTPDFWGNTMFDPHLQENGVWKPFKGYMTGIFAEEALRWIHQDKRPWFCYLSLNAPHVPLQISEEWAAPYLSKGLPERLAKFYGMISNLDAGVGHLLAELKKNGEAENTIVIFLGDNGTALGGDPQPGEFTGGLRSTKASAYQGGVRVPAVFSWPGHFAAGSRVNTLAGLCDVLPTLGQLCHLELESMPASDGRSLAPILLSGKQPPDWPDRFLHTHVARWPSGTPAEELPFRSSSIRNQRHSLVNGTELYDLEKDPGETNDLSKEHPEMRDKLRAAHLAWWEEVRDSAMSPQPFLIGRAGQGPVELTCMDWSPSRATNEPLPPGAFEQECLREWTAGRAFHKVDGGLGGWMVEVETPGTYDLELRQRPADSRQQAPFSKGTATIELNGKKISTDVRDGETTIRLRAELPAGPVFLEPVISGQRPSGKPQGAYFCKISPNLEKTNP
jgi:arylsulfatase A-like enzyme